MSNTAETSVLGRLSNDLASAVETAGAFTVTVSARRRMPATGVIWSNDLIVTSNHVVERDDDIKVGLPDGRTIDATLVGRDQGSDLALLRSSVADLNAARRSDSDAKPGHLVLAIG